MTAEEVYESVTNGGASDFAAAAGVLESLGNWCLIGGLAVNCYVEPVYTVDAHVVIAASRLDEARAALAAARFSLSEFPHSVNARRAGSKLNLQLTTDPRYEKFPGRAERREVLGITVPVAALEDIAQGKIWAWQDEDPSLTKRKKDELDLLRIAEAHPQLRAMRPREIVRLLEDGG